MYKRKEEEEEEEEVNKWTNVKMWTVEQGCQHVKHVKDVNTKHT